MCVSQVSGVARAWWFCMVSSSLLLDYTRGVEIPLPLNISMLKIASMLSIFFYVRVFFLWGPLSVKPARKSDCHASWSIDRSLWKRLTIEQTAGCAGEHCSAIFAENVTVKLLVRDFNAWATICEHIHTLGGVHQISWRHKALKLHSEFLPPYRTDSFPHNPHPCGKFAFHTKQIARTKKRRSLTRFGSAWSFPPLPLLLPLKDAIEKV